jgi:rubredoxin
MINNQSKFFDNSAPDGNSLYNMVMQLQNYNVKPADTKLALPPFMLPYYEGFNRVNNRYWLGIYRRDEKFTVAFLQDVCSLCLSTKIGQLCSTPWKSVIIKGIEEKDRGWWNAVLGKHQVNVRHAANELNFQVEDDCKKGLALKDYLVKHLQQDDTRTFGICIGIKTRRKSEVFSTILVKQKPLFRFLGIDFFNRYDILCANNFNPNERTGFVFSRNNIKWLLPEQLRRAIILFYTQANSTGQPAVNKINGKEVIQKNENIVMVHQCPKCFTVYDPAVGEPENNIPAGTLFATLSPQYCCPLCEEPKINFVDINKEALAFVA